jgi:O-antigen/teichoic acid export membrane protein
LKSFFDRAFHITATYFQEQPWKRDYERSVLWSFTDKGIKFLAELLIGFYLATSLGVANFGVFNYAISFVVLFQGISTLGLSDLLTREFVNQREQQNKILSTSLLMRLVASLCFAAIINFATRNDELTVRQSIFAISLSLVFRSFEVLIYYFQSIVKSEWVAKIQIVTTILISLAKILLISINAQITSFAWVYTVEWVLIALGLFYIYKRTQYKKSWQVAFPFAKKLFLESWPLMVSSIAINIYMRMDQIMLRDLHGNAENGLYAAALRLTEIWYVIPTVIGSIVFPALLNARNRDLRLYEDRLLKLNAFMFWVSFSLACMIAPFSEFLMVNLYNENFQKSGTILSIQIWSGIFSFMGVSGTFWLMAENLQYVSLIRTLLGLMVNVSLNTMLIPKFGGIGAAISMLVTQLFATTLSLIFLKKTRVLLKIQARSIFYPFQLLRELSR